MAVVEKMSPTRNPTLFSLRNWGGKEWRLFSFTLPPPEKEEDGRVSESRALRPKCASYSHTWNDKRGEKIFIAVIYDLATRSVQRWAKERTLSCVNPASWLPLVTGREFTQPRARFIAKLCISEQNVVSEVPPRTREPHSAEAVCQNSRCGY